MKACCYRGAIWRAMEILNETLPRQGIEPDAFTYNTIIAGLARVVSDYEYIRATFMSPIGRYEYTFYSYN